VNATPWELYACTAGATANLIFAALAILRAPGRAVYRVFALTCLCVAAWQAVTLAYHVTSSRWLLAAAIGGAILTTAFLFHLVTLLTVPRPRQVVAVYSVCLALALLGMLWFLEPEVDFWVDKALDAAYLFLTVPIVLISIDRLRRAVRRETDPPARRLLRFILLGTVIGTSLALLDPGRLLQLPIPRVTALGALLWSVFCAAGLLMGGGLHDVVRQLQNLEAAIVGSLQEGVLLLDAEGRIVKANDVARRMLGDDGASIRAHPPLEAAFGERRPLTTLSLGGRSLEVQFSTVRAPAGHSVCVLRDVTEQAEMREQLERSRRLAALGAMMTAIAHEIRNPLASVKGAAQLLQSKAPAEFETHLALIVQEVDRLSASLESYRDFARPLKPELEAVDLPGLLRRTVEFMRLDGLAVDVEARPEIPRVQADPTMVRRVFMNLLRNAREAGADRLRAEFRPGEPGVRAELFDNGPGIPAELRHKIFEPFFTTKSTGSGLGLAIARRIVEAHGGTIAAPEGRIVLWLP